MFFCDIYKPFWGVNLEEAGSLTKKIFLSKKPGGFERMVR